MVQQVTLSSRHVRSTSGAGAALPLRPQLTCFGTLKPLGQRSGMHLYGPLGRSAWLEPAARSVPSGAAALRSEASSIPSPLAACGSRRAAAPTRSHRLCCHPAGSRPATSSVGHRRSAQQAAPNWALEPTHSGSRRKPGPRPLGHHRSPGLRRPPPRIGSAQR
jgi:hypothetical protein